MPVSTCEQSRRDDLTRTRSLGVKYIARVPPLDPLILKRDVSVIQSAQHDARRLTTLIGSFCRPVVAFSGGVDSSVVAAAAYRADPESALAITANSPSVARWQIEMARKVAGEIGIEHHVVATVETEREDYRRNDRRRCFFCKQTLYQTLRDFAAAHPQATLISGTNADDLGDYRPGIDAGKQASVQTPLADLGLTKTDVRSIAGYFGLSNHDLPASPCLASRIAYGTEVTAERLRRIEQAEDWIRQHGFSPLRVRLHKGESARLEVAKERIPALESLDQNGAMTQYLRSLGFQSVSIDPKGLRSGSLNEGVVSLDRLTVVAGEDVSGADQGDRSARRNNEVAP